MTIVERALELVPIDSRLGLGSGCGAQAFVKAIGERIRHRRLRVHENDRESMTITVPGASMLGWSAR
jgi:ribose 5-phosphate isomerase